MEIFPAFYQKILKTNRYRNLIDAKELQETKEEKNSS